MKQAVLRDEAIDARGAPDECPSVRAHLSKLVVTDFRSYRRAALDFDGRPVAIAGENGAGKTNILEAISLLGPGRGLRRAKLDELPRLGGDGGWAVSANLKEEGDERRFGVGVTAAKPDRRICRIDETTASGPGALSDYIRIMWLTPAQDRLFLDGAAERRRFIDRIALTFNAGHSKISSDYEQTMRQRQRLLEEGRSDDRWLGALEQQMAECGVALAAARCETVSMLAAADVTGAGDLFPASDVALEGTLEAALSVHSPIDVEDDFAGQLRANRLRDAAAGRALIGPHRTDFLVRHRAKDRPARLCSTGEQKALLIGLILAGAQNLRRLGVTTPLFILLDEIAAHLDPERRIGLFKVIDTLDAQAFMTGTDKALFEGWGAGAQFFAAKDGALQEDTLA